MSLVSKYNLSLRKLLPEFDDNGRTVSLGSETILRSGSGATEYFSFGDIKIDSSGVIHHMYRRGSGHNLGNDGHLLYQKGTWNGSTYTWTSPAQIITNGSGVYNTTNPALTITSTGRIICFFNKQDLPSSLLTQQTYLIYSDDSGATWSSNGYDGNEIKVSNDRAYLNCIGSAVEQGGILLFPMYSRTSVTSGNEYVVIYQSTDNGLTWTLRSSPTNGTTSTLNNGGETCMLVRADGAIFLNIRGNNGNTQGNYVTWSLDGAVTWYPKPYNIGTTYSKNPMDISPSGTIVTVARDYSTFYTVYGVSINGLQTCTYNRLDNRSGGHMYGGVLWDTIRGHFVVVYYVETGTQYQSPTDIVMRIITEV